MHQPGPKIRLLDTHSFKRPRVAFSGKISHMRKPFKASPRLAAPLLLATASLSLLALHCSSDDGTQMGGVGGTTAPISGSAGTVAQQGGSSSGGMTTGGVTTGGTASGGQP